MLHRNERAAELIKEQVAGIITRDLADPKLGFVTIVGVRMTKDLKRAIIFVSVIGDDAKRKETMAHLKKAAGYIRGQLAHRVTLRYTPELSFEYDTLLEQEQRVGELLRSIHAAEDEKAEA